MRIALAIVLKGYPRLSETFIAQEILALEKRGFDITLYSLRRPTDKQTHPIHDEINARVIYLPEYLYRQPVRVLKSAWKVRKLLCGRKLLRVWWADFRRDPGANRIRRLGQAIVFAAELPDSIKKVYAHFLHTPASVTRYACLMRALPWSCSAHAKDIWTSPKWEISEKLRDCAWLTTCTAANAHYLRNLSEHKNKVILSYHGLDLHRFRCNRPQYTPHDGSDPAHPVTILSVGRAVPKKGYPGLLQALSEVSDDLNWRFIHIGGGPLLEKLKKIAKSLEINRKIEWLGPRSQETVLEYYRHCDFFVLNCRIGEDGDRDGLPNVLVEAQSQGLPVISSGISGVPELITHQHNGILVESENPQSLSRAIERFIGFPDIRRKMGMAGHKIVTERFDMDENHRELQQRLERL